MAFLPRGKSRPWIAKKKSEPWGANQNFYKKANWKRLRQMQLNQEPLCRECKKQGKVKEATVVDHIIPIEEGGPRYDMLNLQSLCESHHNQKSAKEGHRRK